MHLDRIFPGALAALLLALVVPSAAHAQRELSWDALEVDATVKADGSLHVIEEHEMVFDGDWNGGERVFRLGPRQGIELLGLERIDPETGERRSVLPGSLDVVDRWAWTDGTTLRWRSRLPGDPPFDGERIVYRLGYRLSGVLLPRGDDTYLLDHDFAFADREGPIRRFTLDLTVEPPFEAVDGAQVPRGVDLRNLQPGTSVPREVRLRYRGDGVPSAAAPPPPSLLLRLAALAVLLSALGLALALFVRAETGKGRLWGNLPDLPAGGVDRAWLDREVFPLPPEVVGAIWDRKVGSAEVSAVLARLVAEGKLATEVAETDSRGNPKEMRLRQLEHMSTFDPRDRPLVRSILYGGREEVTTRELRNHYKSQGFQPVSLVEDGIEEQVAEVLGDGEPGKLPFPARALGLFVFAMVPILFVASRMLVFDGLDLPRILMALMATFFLGSTIAFQARKRVVRLGRWTLWMLLPAALFLLFVLWLVFAPPSWPGAQALPGQGAVVVLLALALGVWVVPLWLARSSESRRAIEIRQRFVRAREHLKAELARPEPDLDDAWFPYLLAFGLAPAVGRWAQEFGGAISSTSMSTSTMTDGSTAFTGGGSAGSSGFSGGGWTGGGQAFGGAGAAASWAAATGAMTSGVSPPSSSSSGGGGGGGSSSGGGGGGGW